MDEAFHVDIKKSQISLNPELYDWLKNEFTPGPRAAADDRYRRGKKAIVTDKAKSGILRARAIRLKAPR